MNILRTRAEAGVLGVPAPIFNVALVFIVLVVAAKALHLFFDGVNNIDGGAGGAEGSGTPEDGALCSILTCHNMAVTVKRGFPLCKEHEDVVPD